MENDHICLTPYVAVRTVNIDKRKVRMKMRVKVILMVMNRDKSNDKSSEVTITKAEITLTEACV